MLDKFRLRLTNLLTQKDQAINQMNGLKQLHEQSVAELNAVIGREAELRETIQHLEAMQASGVALPEIKDENPPAPE